MDDHSGGHGVSIHGRGYPKYHNIGCLGHNSAEVQHLEHVCHWVCLSILSVFQIEICVKIWLYGWGFWNCPLHVVDFAVVTFSLLLEIMHPWIIGYFRQKKIRKGLTD